MRKVFMILGIMLLVFIVMGGIFFFNIKSQEVPHIEVSNVELSTVEDGKYEGEFPEGPVKVVVTVEVKDSKIMDIIINEHQNGLGKKAEKIVYEIISQQTLDVDVISGATLSSNVIRRAVQEALIK